jgi:hypothetical protein
VLHEGPGSAVSPGTFNAFLFRKAIHIPIAPFGPACPSPFSWEASSFLHYFFEVSVPCFISIKTNIMKKYTAKNLQIGGY